MALKSSVRCLVVAIAFIIPALSFSQLINIENRRMINDSLRLNIQNDFSFKLTSNNGEYIYQFNESLTAHYKLKDLRNIFFLTGNYNLIRTQAKDFSNIWMAHLRYNYVWSNAFRLEAFLQSQNNELLDVNYRQLLGLGLRYRIINNERFHFHLGTTYMYEREESRSAERSDYFHRSSNYAAISYLVEEKGFLVSNTIYFQPLYKKLNDYRLLEEFEFRTRLTKHLSWFARFQYFRDNVTPLGTKQTSINTLIGLGFTI